MTHALGELVLLIPAEDPAAPEQVDELAGELDRREVTHRRVALGRDPEATVRAEIAAGARFLAHCGGQRSLVALLPALLPPIAQPDAPGPDVVLGIFPGGADNDFARTFGLTLHPQAAATLFASPRVMRVDVGVATFRTRGGEARGWVLNDAVVGIGAAAVRRRPRSGPARLLGWWRALLTYRPVHLDVDMVFAEWHAPATEVRLANGQYAHRGLQVAPIALPDDGAWDVQVWAGPKSLPFTLQPRMVRGEHLPHEHISQWRHKRVTVDAARPVPVAIDDRPVGTTPAAFELAPKSLRLKI